jgi:chemotaxis protein methyltransferase CheR
MTTLTGSNTAEFIDLSEREFRLIADLVQREVGINLTDKKKALVKGRLNSLIKSLGCSSFEQYYRTVVEDKTGRRLLSLIDRISTNHSFFFRESDHFQVLRDTVLPELQQLVVPSKSKCVRIWCAGCAGGDEAYTVAMVTADYFKGRVFDNEVGILATDISTSALSEALEGSYSVTRLKSVPRNVQRRYFKQTEIDRYQVTDQIKRMVLFKKLNLMSERYPFKQKFHVIFCRNVMIYFDHITRRSLIKKLHDNMEPGGYLFIGHSETLGRQLDLFRYLMPSVYRKP